MYPYKQIYCKLIEMSVVFDPEIRSSSEEITSFILQQLKLSNRTIDNESYEKFIEYKDTMTIDL